MIQECAPSHGQELLTAAQPTVLCSQRGCDGSAVDTTDTPSTAAVATTSEVVMDTDAAEQMAGQGRQPKHEEDTIVPAEGKHDQCQLFPQGSLAAPMGEGAETRRATSGACDPSLWPKRAFVLKPNSPLTRAAPSTSIWAQVTENLQHHGGGTSSFNCFGGNAPSDGKLMWADFYGTGTGSQTSVYRGNNRGSSEDMATMADMGEAQLAVPRATPGGASSAGATDTRVLWADFYGAGAGDSSSVYRGGFDSSAEAVCRRGVSKMTSVSSVAAGPHRRQQLGLGCVQGMLEVVAKCAAVEKEACFSDWADSTWEQYMALQPILHFAAQPEFNPPPCFQQSMDTCVACLLDAPAGHLVQLGRMVELLDSPDAESLQRYLDWLEVALHEICPGASASSASSCRTVLVPQRVSNVFDAWPAERALLRQAALDLWEAVMTFGPEHQRKYGEWRQAVEGRESIQRQQEEECMQIAQGLEEASAHFSDQLQASSGEEWQQMARTSHAALINIHQLTTELLQHQRDCWGDALEEYEALGARSTACRAAVCEVRWQAQRHERTFNQAAQRFTEVASQLVAWTSTLAPMLRTLSTHRADLRAALQLRRRLPALEREHLTAEDELDLAQTELRKYKRHAQATRVHHCSAQSPVIDTTAGVILERQYELRVDHASERSQSLAGQLREAETKLQEIEAALPLIIDPEEEDGAGNAGGQRAQNARELSSEERMALKLATLEQFHEDVALCVSEVHAERDRVLQQVAERKEKEAMEKQVEPDFMCPIMHERMREPVLAADGHTYERQAIEKWLQCHNTSPMTGAPLVHRYLTENFALRHVIATYEARIKAVAREGSACEDCASSAPLMDGEEEEDAEAEDETEEC
mmetsp:Transcript_62667/g.176679  ORF Transcript_62667/g.176679 Transcript_62667/m.176679 type:complete len:870 (-) Transcript_62667:138-2747(-)